MNDLPYDLSSSDSIKKYADNLTGRSLTQVVNELPLDAYKATNKGRLGSMIEEYFFKYVPGPDINHNPDFKKAGMELKVTGVIPRKPSDDFKASYKAKERLVLTMISYIGLANEEWEDSTFLKKCRLMLILFYLYEKNVPVSDLRFVLPPLKWEFPAEDMKIIQKDWHTIQQKILEGKAHELSEGDTFYLAACRKGSGGEKERLREQPYSDIKAKARAFSLKPSYVNVMIEAAHHESLEKVLIDSSLDAEKGIEEMVKDRFEKLKGRDVNELISTYGLSEHNLKAKGLFHALTMRILGTKKKYLPEFEKAGIMLKTIRLQKNGNPKESMSFPNFDFMELSKQDWEESDLYDTLNQKFLFVIFQYDEKDVLRFKKVMFWNMPYDDRLAAQQAWIRTRQAITHSKPLNFPKASDSPVIHVRPHGRNAKDVLALPDGSSFPKQCFWLNASYIAGQVR